MAAAALLFVAAPEAGAVIDVNEGIRGVDIDMTKRQVTDKIGKPANKKKVKRGGRSFQLWTYGTGGKLKVEFFRGRVLAVETKAVDQRTPGGSGVGSTSAQLLNDIPKITCRNTGTNKEQCTVGERVRGNIVTTFKLKNNVTKSVEVERILPNQ